MDLWGPSNPVDSMGNKYILAIEESYSRYCIFIPLEIISAKVVAGARYIPFLAIPNSILSDQGRQFTSNIFK